MKKVIWVTLVLLTYLNAGYVYTCVDNECQWVWVDTE